MVAHRASVVALPIETMNRPLVQPVDPVPGTGRLTSRTLREYASPLIVGPFAALFLIGLVAGLAIGD